MRPPRGTECVECRKRGHRCEAVIYVDGLQEAGPSTAAGAAASAQDDNQIPVCMACADGEPCAVVKLQGAGRDGSSVQVTQNVWGEVEETGVLGEVVTRTPEELGLARIVADVPVVKERPRVDADWNVGRMTSPMKSAGVKRDRPAQLRTISGVQVRMPANAVMGAEFIDPMGNHGPKQAKSEEQVMSKRGEGKPCAFDGCTHRAYGTNSYCTVKHTYKNKPAKSARPEKQKSARVTPIASARLEKVSSPGATIQISKEIDEAWADSYWMKLTLEQKAAMIQLSMLAILDRATA
jgi:hypothetical protein